MSQYQYPGDYGQRPPPSGEYEYSYDPPPGPPPTRPDGTRIYAGDYLQPPGPPPMRYDGNNEYSEEIGPSHLEMEGPARMQPPSGMQQDQYGGFQYSQMTGRRKALFIGINYTGSNNELHGCQNDVRNVKHFLLSRYGYTDEDSVVLTDDQYDNPRGMPTRQNMIQAMQWLTSDARPNDCLFFHYSGHGGQVRDDSGTKASGYHDCIYPVDFEQAGEIVDDELYFHLVRPLPAGCRLTSIFDSCHSASSLDLPYVYGTHGQLKGPDLLKDSGSFAMSEVASYMRGDIGGMLSGAMSFGKKAMGGSKYQEMARQQFTSPADVIEWAGCKDDQTSADASEGGQPQGAMSWAMLTVLTKYPQLTYQQLLVGVREELSAKYSQKPQLSSSHPMDCNLLFLM